MLFADRSVTRRWALIVSVVAALAIILLRLWLLARYSSSVPSWDPWGAEGKLIYGDWLDGAFDWRRLFDWHNEHRIFFTRVLDLILFVANEMQWDVRVQTLASSLLYAIIAGISIRWILRNVEAPLSIGLTGVVLLCVLSPNGWANAYQGFQSCFYFVLLFALLSIRNAAQTAVSLQGGIVTAVLALAAVFSLAAGVFVAIVCAVIVLVRVWLEHCHWRRAINFVAAPLGVAIWALFDAKKGELHTATVGDFLHSLAIMMSWPYSSFYAVLFWVPGIVFALYVLRTRTATAADLAFGGFALWALLLDIAAAWVRAYNFVDVQSRYTDLLVPSLIAQIYFSFRIVDLALGRRRTALLPKLAGACVGGLLCFGVALASVDEFQKWKGSDFYIRIGASYVRAYVDGDANALDGRLYGYATHPEPEKLKLILDDPTVRSILPLSITPSVPLADQRVRSCRWTPDDGSELPKAGHVVCGSDYQEVNTEGQYYVGRLSAFTYAIWSIVGRQPYPELRRDDEGRREAGPRANCAVDTIDGVVSPLGAHRVPFADVITIGGWIGPSATETTRPPIRFELDSDLHGRFAVNTVAGVVRPDVEQSMQMPGYGHSGFQAYLDGSLLPAGTYHLSVFTATGLECDSGIDVSIDHDADIRLAY